MVTERMALKATELPIFLRDEGNGDGVEGDVPAWLDLWHVQQLPDSGRCTIACQLFTWLKIEANGRPR